jgi:hypothetical protein
MEKAFRHRWLGQRPTADETGGGSLEHAQHAPTPAGHTLWSGHVCRASAWTTRFFMFTSPEIFLQMNGLACRSCLISSRSTLATRSLLATVRSPTLASAAPAWACRHTPPVPRRGQRLGRALVGAHPPYVLVHPSPHCSSQLQVGVSMVGRPRAWALLAVPQSDFRNSTRSAFCLGARFSLNN